MKQYKKVNPNNIIGYINRNFNSRYALTYKNLYFINEDIIHGLNAYSIQTENNYNVGKGYSNMNMEYGHWQGIKLSIDNISINSFFFNYYL